MSTGVIAGGAAGAVVLIVLIVIIAFVVMRYSCTRIYNIVSLNTHTHTHTHTHYQTIYLLKHDTFINP